jgi:hypothetical protein
MYVVSSGSTSCNPSSPRASRSIRVAAAALEISARRTRDVVLQSGALAAALVELEIQAENRHVDRHDAGEERGEHDDPKDPAAQDPEPRPRSRT